jgi:Coenzyme PQQ synthesis protein D (PqqD)
MDPVTRARPVGSVDVRRLEDGAVLLDKKTGMVYQLNKVGAEAWDLLCGGASVAATSDAIATRYSIQRSQAESDVRRLLESLQSAGLVSTQDEAPSK